MSKIEIFCVTNIQSNLLESLKLNLAGVGKKKISKKIFKYKNWEKHSKKRKKLFRTNFSLLVLEK